MQKWHAGAVLFLFIVGTALVAGCGTSVPAEQKAAPATSLENRMTIAGLEATVQGEAKDVRVVGRDVTTTRFGRLDTEGQSGDIPFYAYDTNCRPVIAPTSLQHHSISGQILPADGISDARGMRILPVANDTATTGGGFISYLLPLPPGEFVDDAAVDGYVPVIGYVYPVDGHWWVGSSVYLSSLEGSDPVPAPVKGMIGLVRESTAYGRAYGKEKAFTEISNRSGMFVDSEQHYIYAYDYNRTLLAHPFLPEKIGTSLINRTDPFGMKNIEALTRTAKSGGGYVVFIWPNPDAGNRLETKIGYVLPVDETWWVGSGVYLSEITGEPFYYS